MAPTIPATLQAAIIQYADPNNCLEYLVWKRWANGVTCATCGSARVKFMERHQRWQCSSHRSKRQFSIKTGTIFEDSPLGLDKWLPAMWLITNAKNGISSWEVHRALGVSQKTAWFMLHRIRLSHQGKDGGKLSGEVEVDETFIGGKARNMHADKRAERITGRGPDGKAIVFGMVERGGKVIAGSVDTRKKGELQQQIRENIEAGSAIFSDELKSYDGLDADYQH